MTHEELAETCQTILEHNGNGVNQDERYLAQACLSLLRQLRVAEEALKEIIELDKKFSMNPRCHDAEICADALQQIEALRAGQKEGNK